MKRYAVFTCADYYPKGGWEDYADCADDLYEAIGLAKAYMSDCAHIVDLLHMKIVCEVNKDGTVKHRNIYE